MKTYAGYQFEPYEVSGLELRIHWDIKEVIKEDIDGNSFTQWEANEALCGINDNRAQIIEKIIGSIYTPAAEIATINNKESKPQEYEDYQSFRALAKQLADGWLTK